MFFLNILHHFCYGIFTLVDSYPQDSALLPDCRTLLSPLTSSPVVSSILQASDTCQLVCSAYYFIQSQLSFYLVLVHGATDLLFSLQGKQLIAQLRKLTQIEDKTERHRNTCRKQYTERYTDKDMLYMHDTHMHALNIYE